MAYIFDRSTGSMIEMEFDSQKQKLADLCFKLNKDIDVLYITSDLQIFPVKNNAVCHAEQCLTEKAIDEVWRNDEVKSAKTWGWDGELDSRDKSW